jgi:2-polyprenyl-3-methyl-5-hydroxy-6-metoxy-1,4-benzoquinol methylase
MTIHGSVVATDLADEVLERAQRRFPDVRFVSGDVMTVDVGSGFDVVVSLEVLSHVQSQVLFIRRLHDWLKPHGHLMLATQNRPVLSRFNRIPAPAPGQLRRWVSRRELADLLTTEGFRIDKMFVVSPKADHGIMRIMAKLGRMTRTTRLLERAGFGWTIMVLATRGA